MRTDRLWTPAGRRAAALGERGAQAAAAGLLALGLVALAAGCASTTGGDAIVATDTAGAAPHGPGHADSATAPGDTTPPAGSTLPARSPARAAVPAGAVLSAPVCAASGLTGAVQDADGTAGHVYGKLVFTNTGPAACRLAGFPDVRFADASGAAIGAPADHDEGRGTPAPVLLAPAGTAVAVLRITQAGIQQGCLATDTTRAATALRVSLPDSSGVVPIALPGSVPACVAPEVRQLLVGPLAG